MTTENILDVTVLDPRQKHTTIFDRFDALDEGETLTLHNDHDPKPLYYQMIGERGNTFNWEYLEQGPEWWKVKITKRINDREQETVGELAARDLRKVEVFRKYGIDFCCGGKKTVKEACEDKGIDASQVEQELQQANAATASRPLPYNEWGIDFLAEYIVNTHHAYVRKTLPEIMQYGQKVASVHGDNHPELKEIYTLVQTLRKELDAHLMKEERILFPYIKELVATSGGHGNSFSLQFGSVHNPINIMQMEHDSAGDILLQIRKLSSDYILPEDACASYSVYYRLLPEFEEDLHLHIHLENNILFPKSIAMEEQIKNNG